MTHGKCGPWCKFEQHVSGDVSFAVRQYYYNTGDLKWLREIGWDLVKGIPYTVQCLRLRASMARSTKMAVRY